MNNTQPHLKNLSSPCQAPTTKPFQVVSGSNKPKSKFNLHIGNIKLLKSLQFDVFIESVRKGSIADVGILRGMFVSIISSGNIYNGSAVSDGTLKDIMYANGDRSIPNNLSKKQAENIGITQPFGTDHINRRKNHFLAVKKIIKIIKRKKLNPKRQRTTIDTPSPKFRIPYVIKKLKDIIPELVFLQLAKQSIEYKISHLRERINDFICNLNTAHKRKLMQEALGMILEKINTIQGRDFSMEECVCSLRDFLKDVKNVKRTTFSFLSDSEKKNIAGKKKRSAPLPLSLDSRRNLSNTRFRSFIFP